MDNSTDSDANAHSEPEWPKAVVISPTIETAREALGYGEHRESDDALLYEMGQMMRHQDIESWAELEVPRGFEIYDEEEREEYERFLRGED